MNDQSIERTTSTVEIFSGWKEIASYLGKGVRTIQRYEREVGLPIHRPAGKSRAAVIATRTELDGWVTAGPVRATEMPRRTRSPWSTRQTNKNGVNFLLIDSHAALTFSAIAMGAADSVKKQRTTFAARKAYDTISRLRNGLWLSDAEEGKLDANLQRLKNELQQLGQSF
jgi:hypothetical protein